MTGEQVIQQDTPPAGDGSQEGDTGSQEMPAWAQQLHEDNKELKQALRTAQGQANRAEAQVSALQPILGSLLQAQQTGRQPTAKTLARAEDAVSRLAADDPAKSILQGVIEDFRTEIGNLRGEVGTLQGQVGQVSGHVQRQTFSEAEQRDRAYCMETLEATADLAGIDFGTVKAELEALPTAGMYNAGMGLLKKAKAAPAEHAKALRDKGLYTGKRPGAASNVPSRANLRLADFDNMTAEQVADMKLTREEIAAIHGRG